MYSNEKYKRQILNVLIPIDPYTREYYLFQLMDDKFGNFVIQKMFEYGGT